MTRERSKRSQQDLESTLDRAMAGALGVLVCGFTLAAGSAPPHVVVVGAFAVTTLAIATLLRKRKGQRKSPTGLLLGLALAWFAFVHWLPLGTGFTGTVAPRLVELHQELGLPAPQRVSVFPGNTLVEACRLMSLVVLYWIGSQLPRPLVLWAVLAAGAVAAVAMGVHIAAGADQVFGVYQPIDLPPGSKLRSAPFINPNHLAHLMVVSGLVGAGLTWHMLREARRTADGRGHRNLQSKAFVAGLGTTACLAALTAAGSQGGWLLGACGLVAAIVILSSRTERKWIQRASVALGVVAVGAAFALTFQVAEDAAIDRKIATNLDAMRMLELSPILGTGRGTFVDLHSSYAGGPVTFTHAESSWVGFVLECGPVAAALLGVGVGVWMVGAWRGRKRRRDRVAIVAVTAAVLGATWEFALDLNGVAAPVALLAGSLATSRESARWVPWALICSSAVLSALAIPAVSRSRITSEPWPDQILAGDLSPDTALEARPFDGRLHWAAARVETKPQVALQAALRASRLRPDTVDAPIYAASLARSLAQGEVMHDQLALGFSRLQEPPPPEWVTYVRGAFGAKSIAAGLLDTPEQPKALLLASLLQERPRFADDVSALLLEEDAADIQALRTRVAASLTLGRTAFASQLADELIRVAPTSAFAHRDWARARRAKDPTKAVETEIQAGLLSALERDLDNPSIVKQAFIRSVLIAPTSRGIVEADRLVQELQLAASTEEESKRYRSLRGKLDKVEVPQPGLPARGN